jgi:hypothetical protein
MAFEMQLKQNVYEGDEFATLVCAVSGADVCWRMLAHAGVC